MRPLSATEAISPAIERARDVLTRPFRWQTFLKLTAVAFFAEIGGSFNTSFPGRSHGATGLSPAVVAFFVAFAVLIGVVALILGLILFYIGSRLQLVLVEVVATRQSWISPVWRRVGPSTWRWIGLKILYFLAVIALVVLLAIPFVLYFGLHFHDLGNFFHGAFAGLHIFTIVLMVLGAIAVLMVFAAVYMLLRAFALPSFVFEDVTISESLRRVRNLVAAEPGQIALFLLLKMLLVFVFAIAAEIGIFFILLLSLIPFAIVGGILWFALHSAGAVGTAILIAAAVVGGLFFIVWIFLVCIAILGSVYTFSQAYSLYFLGGRYPLLGDLLDRSTPLPWYAQAPHAPPATLPPQPAPEPQQPAPPQPAPEPPQPEPEPPQPEPPAPDPAV